MEKPNRFFLVIVSHLVQDRSGLVSFTLSGLFQTPGTFVSNYEIQNHFSSEIQQSSGQIGRYKVNIENIIELSEEAALEFSSQPSPNSN